LYDLDSIIRASLVDFADRRLRATWYGKEHNWVSLYVFGHLLPLCQSDRPLFDPTQIAIEVGVPQPPGYVKTAANRDVVIWERPCSSCWNLDGAETAHPMAIVEWKVHRHRRRNREVPRERKWLREYCAWQPQVLAYAVELEAGEERRMGVTRFAGTQEDQGWLAR
jgi:hypothetical protein